MFGENVERLLIDKEENFEIDEEFDFWIVEQILLRRLKLNGCINQERR
ncbi:MAG: hypothetical protein NT033_02895 [Candidatus Omnitrophica bacterium]|nr:hypothetical protein [Candidatus Omnitrophota bacterium]